MDRPDMFFRARQIAEMAYEGKVDKAEMPSLERSRRVAAAVVGIPEKIVAMLHAVVATCPEWTLDRLRTEGFSRDIIDTVDAMTKRPGEDYFVAILRARGNVIARRVKLADLADNSDRILLTEISEREERRLDKYARAARILRDDERDH